MRTIIFALFFLLNIFCYSHAQHNDVFVHSSKTRVAKDVYTLASDSMRGRQFPDEGREKAALYIARQFQEAGLKGINKGKERYFQKIPATKIDLGRTVIKHNDETLRSGSSNAFSFASTKALDDSLSIPVKFVGYSSADIIGHTGKDTLIYFLAYDMIDAQKRLEELAQNTGAKYFGFSIREEKLSISGLFYNEAYNLISNEKNLAQYKYSTGVFGTGEEHEHDWLYNYIAGKENDIGVFLFHDNFFEKYFGQSLRAMHRDSRRSARQDELPEPVDKELNFITNFRLIEIQKYDDNVIGYIEGTELKDEVVIICGHYDHLGKRGDEIYYGADDNASGTAAVMELARMFKQAKNNGMKFKRSVVFVAFGAEESGLNGSSYYVENPVFPLEKTALVINLDMIGRSDQPADVPGHAFVLPMQGLRSPVWRAFRNTGRQIDGIRLERVWPSLQSMMFYFGSDHYPFMKNDVPAVNLNTGMHPDYHQPTDTPDKINYDNLINIIKTTFVVAAKVASDPVRFPLN